MGTPHNTRNGPFLGPPAQHKHEFINGPFKVLQLSDNLTNHRTVYSDQSNENTKPGRPYKRRLPGPVKISRVMRVPTPSPPLVTPGGIALSDPEKAEALATIWRLSFSR